MKNEYNLLIDTLGNEMVYTTFRRSEKDIKELY